MRIPSLRFRVASDVGGPQASPVSPKVSRARRRLVGARGAVRRSSFDRPLAAVRRALAGARGALNPLGDRPRRAQGTPRGRGARRARLVGCGCAARLGAARGRAAARAERGRSGRARLATSRSTAWSPSVARTWPSRRRPGSPIWRYSTSAGCWRRHPPRPNWRRRPRRACRRRRCGRAAWSRPPRSWVGRRAALVGSPPCEGDHP